MKQEEQKATEAQGAEEAKKERNDSQSYALKSLATLIKKCQKNKWTTPEQNKQMIAIYKGLTMKFMGGDLFE